MSTSRHFEESPPKAKQVPENRVFGSNCIMNFVLMINATVSYCAFFVSFYEDVDKLFSGPRAAEKGPTINLQEQMLNGDLQRLSF